MNKLMVMALMVFALLLTSGFVLAAEVESFSIDKVKIHAVDNNNVDLEGVLVAPEWKFEHVESKDLKLDGTGWNDFFPKDDVTNSNGYASHKLWIVVPGELLQINYATLDGYTCTSGESTRITAVSGLNVLETVCTLDNEVPEFGVIAGAIALVAGLGIIVYRRK